MTLFNNMKENTLSTEKYGSYEYKLVNDCLIMDNFLPPEECRAFIDFHHQAKIHGFGYRVLSSSVVRQDETIMFEPDQVVEGMTLARFLNPRLFDVALRAYLDNYPTLEEYFKNINEQGGGIGSHHIKVQRTVPGGGFHKWHWERTTDIPSASRILTWTVYLNTVNHGGETEFLHRGLRIEPLEGRLCLFPCDFTTAHRGNPPLKEDKYIATGWFEVAL